jgi:hypothetical protein
MNNLALTVALLLSTSNAFAAQNPLEDAYSKLGPGTNVLVACQTPSGRSFVRGVVESSDFVRGSNQLPDLHNTITSGVNIQLKLSVGSSIASISSYLKNNCSRFAKLDRYHYENFEGGPKSRPDITRIAPFVGISEFEGHKVGTTVLVDFANLGNMYEGQIIGIAGVGDERYVQFHYKNESLQAMIGDEFFRLTHVSTLSRRGVNNQSPVPVFSVTNFVPRLDQ